MFYKSNSLFEWKRTDCLSTIYLVFANIAMDCTLVVLWDVLLCCHSHFLPEIGKTYISSYIKHRKQINYPSDVGIKGRTINLVSFVKIYITDILYKPEKDVNPHHALWVFDLMDRIECRTTLINILLALLFQYQKLFWLKYFVEISKNLKYFI